MPLRDVPERLRLVAGVVDRLNLELAHVIGMAMGAGWTEFHEMLGAIGTDYLAVEHALTGWRLALRPTPGEAFAGEEDDGGTDR